MEEILLKQSALIACDFEAIKARLQDQIKPYENMVFTEESKKEAKNTVADLRKEQKAFKERIQQIKIEYMKPYDEFLTKATELVDLYNKPIGFINEQIEAFENQRIEDKKKVIDSIYKEMIPEDEMQAILPLKIIYNSKWENATFTEKQIKDEMMQKKIEVKQAITTITAMDSDKVSEAVELYKKTFDLAGSIKFIQDYERNKKEVLAIEAEKLRRAEEDRIRAEERAKIQHEQALIQAQEEARAEVVDTFIPEVEEGATEAIYSYEITLTDKQKEALEIYMNTAGITYELIDLPF